MTWRGCSQGWARDGFRWRGCARARATFRLRFRGGRCASGQKLFFERERVARTFFLREKESGQKLVQTRTSWAMGILVPGRASLQSPAPEMSSGPTSLLLGHVQWKHYLPNASPLPRRKLAGKPPSKNLLPNAALASAGQLFYYSYFSLLLYQISTPRFLQLPLFFFCLAALLSGRSRPPLQDPL